jgi:hypothetical protein
MSRVRIIGLALVAVLAFSAVAVASASAKEFQAEKYNVVVKAHNTATQVFKIGGTTVECKKVTFESNNPAVTPPNEIAAAATTLRVKVTSGAEEYQECKAFGIVGATVKMNECNYVFHAPTTPTSNVGSVDIVCPTGKVITIEAGGCTVSVGAQTGLEKVTYAKVGTGSGRMVEVTPAVEKIAYKTNKAFLCPAEKETTLYSGANLAEGLHNGAADGIFVE